MYNPVRVLDGLLVYGTKSPRIQHTFSKLPILAVHAFLISDTRMLCCAGEDLPFERPRCLSASYTEYDTVLPYLKKILRCSNLTGNNLESQVKIDRVP